jgi:hypothetical protein
MNTCRDLFMVLAFIGFIGWSVLMFWFGKIMR